MAPAEEGSEVCDGGIAIDEENEERPTIAPAVRELGHGHFHTPPLCERHTLKTMTHYIN